MMKTVGHLKMCPLWIGTVEAQLIWTYFIQVLLSVHIQSRNLQNHKHKDSLQIPTREEREIPLSPGL